MTRKLRIRQSGEADWFLQEWLYSPQTTRPPLTPAGKFWTKKFLFTGWIPLPEIKQTGANTAGRPWR
jgi:hypothetical protein